MTAFHGGSLERGTHEIASLAARRAGSSYYGVLMPENLRWHAPSVDSDPVQSTALAALLGHVRWVVAVHG